MEGRGGIRKSGIELIEEQQLCQVQRIHSVVQYVGLQGMTCTKAEGGGSHTVQAGSVHAALLMSVPPFGQLREALPSHSLCELHRTEVLLGLRVCVYVSIIKPQTNREGQLQAVEKNQRSLFTFSCTTLSTWRTGLPSLHPP